ncbi:DUF4127 family protein [Gorillibacterium timonense]|uniref:DUF4127 family protein n=1 Tax=Gorillibacterium timonense TaxID=1689269 RepID=UPI00071D8380|nr:DUF4127 family protein [Gorillibacterium timonense]
MGTIVYLPLDERPCNFKYPQMLAELGSLPLVAPPTALLGRKKQPADHARLTEWLLEATRDASHLIVSIDMLVYGGIVPSRLHSLSAGECEDRIEALARCKAANPALRIYAFNLIMRAPAYNGSDEEPDYYDQYGASLHRYGWLLDKGERETLSADESEEYAAIRKAIPEAVLTDFTGRRLINAGVNEHCIRLVQEGILDHLVIPLDDNSRYGFTSMEQRRLLFEVEANRLMDRVLIYPGADEIGCTLLARVFCEQKGYTPEAYVRYSSTNGPFILPRYEDRSLNESIKAHLTASGGFMADSSVEADFVLMVNSPPVSQAEAAESNHRYPERHRAYFSEVNLPEFVKAVHTYAVKGKFVALADVATANGADEPLMQLLAQTGGLSLLSAYAGWNTSGNAMGTVVAHAVIASYYASRPEEDSPQRLRKSKQFLVYRLLEDWGYQSNIRAEINLGHLLGHNEINERTAEEGERELYALLASKLSAFYDRYLSAIVSPPFRIEEASLPWKRTFEVDFELGDC